MISSGTIAAISSAGGRGGRIIVRISGAAAHDLAGAMLLDPIPGPARAATNGLRFRSFDVPVWVYVFSAPRSYTGEDLVELHLPGNPLLAQDVLNQLLASGARQAEPGEFTARAYFARRMNLAEAEGVAATISASNEQELRAARQLLAGELSRRLRPVMDIVSETLGLIEVGLDFSDQDVTFLSDDEIDRRISEATKALQDLVQNTARYERLSHEPHFVLVGRPNAGKSTLLNALAGHQRAVVSPVAGTTRDALSAEVKLPGGMVRVSDVAGLEHSRTKAADVHGHVADQMQEQANRAVESAEHVVLVTDITDITDTQPPLALSREPDLQVLTKLDLFDGKLAHQIAVSAHTGAGMNELRRQLNGIAFKSAASASTLALNARHLQAISQAQEALHRARAVSSTGPEIVALELREALNCLGQILGLISPDEVLGQIFATFCIGK